MTEPQHSQADSLDAYKPAIMARMVEEAGVRKAGLPLVPLLTLTVLAGAFIAFGGAFYLVTISGAEPLTGVTRFVGGLAFSLGLVLVIVGGAELFTGNALMVMAAVDGLIRPGALMRNWAVAYAGNFAGAVLIAALCAAGGLLDGEVGPVARRVAEAKLNLGWGEAFARGVLCNALVCLAVWLTFGARTAAGKVLVILLPISAFVALGFEHSVANMFLLPLGILAGAGGSIQGVLGNLLPVTLGNIVGGGGGVALAYWLAYGGRPLPGGR